ncbi:MAG: hypothetical protein NG740_05845 [Omnitrophica bacterium]|nr:hypothetical protein [Candidatus Omnitrophota bacterium]
MMKSKFKKIIFLQDPSEVDTYIKHNRQRLRSRGDKLLIAMTPRVCSRLAENNLTARDTVRYFTNESHARVLKKSRALVEWLDNNFSLTDMDLGIERSYKDTFLFRARFVINYCLWASEVVVNAVEMHRPEILQAASLGRRNVPSLFVEPEERYLGHIVREAANKKNIRFENLRRSKRKNDKVRSLGFCGSRYRAARHILKCGKFQLWEKSILLKTVITCKKPVLFTTRFYGMQRLADEMRQTMPGERFYFLEGPAVGTFYASRANSVLETKKIFKNLITLVEKEKELFSFRGISFSELVAQKIGNTIADFISGMRLWVRALGESLNRLKPRAVISNGNRSDDMFLAELCHKKGIPAVLISHGSHVRPKNEYERIEWGEHGRTFLKTKFPFLAMQSPLYEGYLDVFPTASRTIKTGPMLWGRPVNLQKARALFNKMFEGRYDFNKTRVVLHAGTPKSSDALRLYVYETPDEYIRSIRELAAAVLNIPNTILVVRSRPTREIGIGDLKRLVPFSEKIILSTDEPFTDILGMSSLLVSFSSTTIEEALQNRIPVLFYGCAGRYQHIAAPVIKKGISPKPQAVYHAKAAEDAEYAIRHILDLGLRHAKYRYLFEPYIYSEEEREDLVDLLNEQLKKGAVS